VLLVTAGVTVFALDETGEGLAILAIVVLNTAIATVQEARAERAISALSSLASPSARVRRDGRLVMISSSEVVADDIVEVEAGDRVPADIELIEVVAMSIDESILTGEAFPVDKLALIDGHGEARDDHESLAFAGTLVLRGRGAGRVRHTGARTQLGRIATQLGHERLPPLVFELRRTAAIMSAISVTLGALFLPLAYWRGHPHGARFVDALLASVALAVAAIPEGLSTVVVGALALGARRLASRGAIVRNLPAIEALGATTVLCTDKTGTLTTGELAIAGVDIVAGLDEPFWRAAAGANDAVDGLGDPLDVVLLDEAQRQGARDDRSTRLAELPLDASTKSMTVIHQTSDGPRLWIKGAPEVVLARCRPGEEVVRLYDAVDDLTARGYRVLALADAETSDVLSNELRALGVVAFTDTIRESAAPAAAALRRAGVRVVVVTGDHAATARAIASAVGIGGRIVAQGDLAGLDAQARASALAGASVVARVDPFLKAELVDAHHARREVVAMTGDGVNDAPAIRRADIGIALAGGAGTDVARDAADIVITDGRLSTIVDAVGEGRRIYRNLRNVVSYLVAGNISEILVVVAALLIVPELAVPLLPVQLLWINLVTDGVPALALGVDRAPGDPLAEPPRPLGERLLDRARLVRILGHASVLATVVLATGVIAHRRGWEPTQVRTQLVLTLLVGQLLLACVVRASRFTFERGWAANRGLVAAIGLSIGLQVVMFTTPVGRAALGLRALPPYGWALSVGAAAFMAITIDLARLLTARRRRDLRL
jgi:Ca2+-transporting ATPase